MIELDTHDIGDPGCRHCWTWYPKPCKCGGLIHANFGDYSSEDSYYLETGCDKCGESEEATND